MIATLLLAVALGASPSDSQIKEFVAQSMKTTTARRMELQKIIAGSKGTKKSPQSIDSLKRCKEELQAISKGALTPAELHPMMPPGFVGGLAYQKAVVSQVVDPDTVQVTLTYVAYRDFSGVNNVESRFLTRADPGTPYEANRTIVLRGMAGRTAKNGDPITLPPVLQCMGENEYRALTADDLKPFLKGKTIAGMP